MTYGKKTWRAGALAALLPVVALAQTPVRPPSPKNTQTEGYLAHQAAARQAAVGLAVDRLGMCELPSPSNGPPTGGGASAPIKPGKVFDNLYYVGLRGVSAWAIDTSDGIVLIDALNDGKDAEETIVPGLRAVGLDPARLKYVIITHGHADHWGGARYLADTYKARVISSDADWDMMYGPPQFAPNPLRGERPLPKRDLSVKDGEVFKVGDTPITFYITPGHTPGTLSIILPVTDHGDKHVAVMWGGMGFNFPPTPANFETYGASAARFRDIAKAAGADVVLANHPFADNTLKNLPVLEARKPGDPNPYVVGGPVVGSFLTVLSECARARGAAIVPGA